MLSACIYTSFIQIIFFSGLNCFSSLLFVIVADASFIHHCADERAGIVKPRKHQVPALNNKSTCGGGGLCGTRQRGREGIGACGKLIDFFERSFGSVGESNFQFERRVEREAKARTGVLII